MKRFPPIVNSFPHFLHGGDYNPDQWERTPYIIDEDFRLMPEAHCNSFTIGIFSWSRLEPSEGQFDFGWLDRIMDRIADVGGVAVLATPSGARPDWLSYKYPEVRRILSDGRRDLHGGRHNHCYSSPIYREKVAIINGKLAERYAGHPALGVWHISNEYNGCCYCDDCLDNFRNWLKARYGTLDALNNAWWTGFWSHTVTDWKFIEPRETYLDGKVIDWKRFVTHMTCDFMANEVAALRKFDKTTPVTTNMMSRFNGINYFELGTVCDVISNDVYPQYSSRELWISRAVPTTFNHSLMRSIKGKPFMLMESCPSATNWQPVSKLKDPGIHRLEMLNAVGAGADTCQYFQWRKGRGGSEKFHGAVVDHVGNENTRVFREVAEVGGILEKLNDVVGTGVESDVAILYDWESVWALDACGGPSRDDKRYNETCESHYKPFWLRGVNVDILQPDYDFTKYKLVLAPMLFMLRNGLAEKMRDYVSNGGTLVLTYLTGIVNESNLCFLGGWPGDGLRELAGVWAEEIDNLYPEMELRVTPTGNEILPAVSYDAVAFADRIHVEGAEVVAVYADQFYAGDPALTVNKFGKGECWYVAARDRDGKLIDDLYAALLKRLSIRKNLDADLPEGVTVLKRGDETTDYLFVLNTRREAAEIDLSSEKGLTDMLTGEDIAGTLTLERFGTRILKRPR